MRTRRQLVRELEQVRREADGLRQQLELASHQTQVQFDRVYRDVQLAEWDLLRSIELENRTMEQSLRLAELVEQLWPPIRANPINGIRRVPGGHGYPIRYKATELLR